MTAEKKLESLKKKKEEEEAAVEEEAKETELDLLREIRDMMKGEDAAKAEDSIVKTAEAAEAAGSTEQSEAE